MPAPARVIRIELGSSSYDIVVGRGVMQRAESFEGLGDGGDALIVSNTTVGPLYADRLAAALHPIHAHIGRLEVPDGEAHKDGATLNRILDHLIDEGYDRRSMLYALGGGVVGDLTGFAAACYMRGVAYVQVPTTLLAQVDSSVGGKTGINHLRSKNMIGAFHQPRRVVADLEALRTLPDRELVAGLAEVIKYGPVADTGFFDWTEAHADALRERDDDALLHAIVRSCELKASVVSQDEREAGLRAILNFGHTFGHAIEALLGFGTWLHGEAVGCGMVMAADLSARLGQLALSDAARVQALVARVGLPVRCPRIEPQRYLAAMRHDKKAVAGALRFVVLDGLGRARSQSVDDELVVDVLRAHME